MGDRPSLQDNLANSLAELLVREISQSGYGSSSDTSVVPALSPESKFAAFTFSPPPENLPPSRLVAGLFLSGSQTPYSRIPGVGYWTDSPRRLWLMVFDRTTQAFNTTADSKTFALDGRSLTDGARVYRALERAAHWIPVSAGVAIGAFPAALMTTVQVVEIPGTPAADYGSFDTSSVMGVVGAKMRTDKATFSTGTRTMHVDSLDGSLAMLRRDGSVEIGVGPVASVRHLPATNVAAGAGGASRTYAADATFGQSIGVDRVTFRVSVASSRYDETEAAAISRVGGVAASLTSYLNGQARYFCDRGGYAQGLSNFSAVGDASARPLPGDLDTWFSSIVVSYSLSRNV
jgi:hypothetical protein